MAWRGIRTRIEIALQKHLFRFIAFSSAEEFVNAKTTTAKDALTHLNQVEHWFASLSDESKARLATFALDPAIEPHAGIAVQQIVELETFDFNNGRALIQKYLDRLAQARMHLKNRDAKALKEIFKQFSTPEGNRIDLVGGPFGLPREVPDGEDTISIAHFRLHALIVHYHIGGLW